MTDSSATPRSRRPRRWTILAAAFLLLALAAVVLYTREGAFRSPVALVVMAAIGMAALLLQIRYRPDMARVRSSSWLNLLGLLCALAAIFSDVLHLSATFMLVAALLAVFCFGVSGALVLRALRRRN
jgi:drug/metabolite transporter (DMT)-like permease